MHKKIAIIIGAGPAGLTAAYEFLSKTDIKPIIFEMSGDIGGIAKTIDYKGNKLDLGPHRFFSKSNRVVAWWLNIFPLLPENKSIFELDGEKRFFLICNRVTRILFNGRFFDYPVSLSLKTLTNLGFIRLLKIVFSYIGIRLSPIRDEKTLEDFFMNRFGKELYLIFFKDYTEKVWGVSCDQIQADWGAQRVKGLSITTALKHAFKKLPLFNNTSTVRETETSLIEKFMYPILGTGYFWEEVANQIRQKGGEVYLNHTVIGIKHQNNLISEVIIKDGISGKISYFKGDYFLSTMPVKDLVHAFGDSSPVEVSKIAETLVYRNFVTVGLLVRKLKIKNFNKSENLNELIPDNWVYIQDPHAKIGRLQIFNNWTPFMVKDKNTVWLGLEYFCGEDDSLWEQSNESFIELGISELTKIGFIKREDVMDAIAARMPKAYPAYFGGYSQFPIIKNFTDRFENLFLIGRNGMHRYNNMDHSMLTAMIAVENIVAGIKYKDNIWAINTEQEYHEKNK